MTFPAKILGMKNFFKNQLGVSMIQVSAIAAVMGGVALLGTKMITSTKHADKGADSREKIEDFHEKIFTVFKNGADCRETMVTNGKTVEVDTDDPFDLTTVNTTGSVVAEVNKTYMNNSISLDGIKVLPHTDADKKWVEVTYGRLNANNPDLRTGSGYGGRSIKKRFELQIHRISGAFEICYALAETKDAIGGIESLEEEDPIKMFCDEIAASATGQKIFRWNEAEGRCEPNGQCPADQIYVGIDSSGEVLCKNIEDWLDFNDILDPSNVANCAMGQPASLGISPDGKKIVIKCLSTM